MADRRTPKRKNEMEPKNSTAKKARGTSVASRASSVAESHDDATQTTNLDAHGAEVHWEWENEEEVITKTTITEDRIIALRSKTISTPIQRSVLAVSHIYTHGRQLHEGDIGRLVNADEDEVLEVDSDNESEISTPARRLYQRGSMGGSGRSVQSDTAPVRRSSRARDNDTTSESGLQSLEHASSTSRSSRRSSGSARISAPIVASSSSSSSAAPLRRTSSAAATAALTIATPNRRRSTRGGDSASVASSAGNSAASTPQTSRQSSPTASPRTRNTRGRGVNRGSGSGTSSNVVLAPAAMAFNQSNVEYVPPDNSYDDDYLPDTDNTTANNTNANNAHASANDNDVVAEDANVAVQLGLVQRLVRVVTATSRHYLKSLFVVLIVVLVCICAVYLRAALTARPTHISHVDTFKYDVKHVNTTSAATLQLQQELDTQRVELERINAQLLHSKERWNEVVSSAESSVASEVGAANSAAIAALDSFASDTTLLDSHLHALHTQVNTTTTSLHTTLHTLRAEDAEEVQVFTAELSALAPQVANLTAQAQEMHVLVESGVTVLQAVVAELPHSGDSSGAHSADRSASGDSSDAIVSVEDVIATARAAELHITATNTAKASNNTLLNTTAVAAAQLVDTALHTLSALQADYAAAHESLTLQTEEALKLHNVLQAEGIARAQASVDAALQATLLNEELRVQYETQAAAVREAERIAEEERLLAEQVNVLGSREAEGFVRATAEPLLGNNGNINTLRTTLQEKVSSGVSEVVSGVLEQNRVHNIDTVNSDIVQNTVRAHTKAQAAQFEAIHLHKHATSSDADTTSDSDTTSASAIAIASADDTVEPVLPLEDYAVGVRGGSVVHYRRTTKSHPYSFTTIAYKPEDGNWLNALNGRHGRGGKKHTPFPRVPTASVVINHHRPTVDGFYPLDMHASSGKSSMVSSVGDTIKLKSDSKGSTFESAAHMTVLLNDLTHVYSVKLVHATRNTSHADSASGTDSSDGSSTGDRGSVVQACAPRSIVLKGWTDDPTPSHSRAHSVDLGKYIFDPVEASTSYMYSDSSAEGTAVYEQEFHVMDFVHNHSESSSGSSSGSSGDRSVGLSAIASAPLLKALTLQVESNHGEEHFSCVHRIQVLGVLQRDVQHALKENKRV